MVRVSKSFPLIALAKGAVAFLTLTLLSIPGGRAQDYLTAKSNQLEAQIQTNSLRQRLNRRLPAPASIAPAIKHETKVPVEPASIEKAFPVPSNIGEQFPLSATVGEDVWKQAVTRFSSSAERFNLKLPLSVNAQEFARLSPYDIVVIIDNSGSMNERDCPGGLSRWQWCAQQTLDASRQLKAGLNRPITLALFSEHFKIFPRSDYLALSSAFNVNSPGGGTYLSKPLRAVFDDYFQRKARGNVRKLLVQVITDGEPSDKGACLDLLQSTAAKIGGSAEIKVSFIEIGTDKEGQQILQEFAQADQGGGEFINSLSFEQVKSQGLLKALAMSLGSY